MPLFGQLVHDWQEYHMAKFPDRNDKAYMLVKRFSGWAICKNCGKLDKAWHWCLRWTFKKYIKQRDKTVQWILDHDPKLRRTIFWLLMSERT